MNANELADKLSNVDVMHKCDGDIVNNAEAMLRQQQAEIEALKSRELTDEEIKSCWEFESDCQQWVIDFARAILRKAQDK